MTEQSKKTPPEIITDEDAPFETNDQYDAETKEDKFQSTNAPADMDLRKFSLGSNTLGWCIFLMCLCVFASFFAPDNQLLNSAFEAFKLIVMTILGYIFGTQSKE